MTAKHFDGQTFDQAKDGQRLSSQLIRVANYMLSHDWRTLAKIRHDLEYLYQTNVPEASISARLRDLRKDRFGAWIVERRRADNKKGLYEYRVRKPEPVFQAILFDAPNPYDQEHGGQ